MNGLVVDASVAIKGFVEEPDSVEAVAARSAHLRPAHQLLVDGRTIRDLAVHRDSNDCKIINVKDAPTVQPSSPRCHRAYGRGVEPTVTSTGKHE